MGDCWRHVKTEKVSLVRLCLLYLWARFLFFYNRFWLCLRHAEAIELELVHLHSLALTLRLLWLCLKVPESSKRKSRLRHMALLFLLSRVWLLNLLFLRGLLFPFCVKFAFDLEASFLRLFDFCLSVLALLRRILDYCLLVDLDIKGSLLFIE